MLSSTVPVTYSEEIEVREVKIKVKTQEWQIKADARTRNRWTRVGLSCPIRWTRPTACASVAGFKSGSTRITCCASRRLRPLAPSFTKSSRTWILWTSFSVPLNLLMAVCDFLQFPWNQTLYISLLSKLLCNNERTSQLKLFVATLPSSFHPDESDAVGSEGMFQHIKNIVPAGENKNLRLWVTWLDP